MPTSKKTAEASATGPVPRTDVGDRFRQLMEEGDRPPPPPTDADARFRAWCAAFRPSKTKPGNIWQDCRRAGATVRLTVFRDDRGWGWCVACEGGALQFSPQRYGCPVAALLALWRECEGR